MKHLFRILGLAVFHFLQTGPALATHAIGGEFSYVWLHDSTYRVNFRFYRDCAGATNPVNFQLCYTNSCATPVMRNTAQMNLVPNSPGFVNGSGPGYLCPGVKSVCDSLQSAIPGYQSWVYSCDIVLSGHCDQWILSTNVATRTGTTNTPLPSGAQTSAYYEAVLNNLTAPHNSSPVFGRLPLRASCLGASLSYDPWITDPDGDSLVAELVTLRNSTSPNCTATSTNSPVTYNAGYTATQPVAGIGFSLNPATAAVSFVPNQPGTYALAIRVSDYRNGIKMGSVTREYQHVILNCNGTTLPQLAVDPASLPASAFSNGQVTGHAGYPLSFCFNASSSSASAVLVVSDAHATAIPGSSLGYTGQLSNQVRGCFGWTPALSDTGLHYLPVTAVDSTCNGDGMLFPQSYTIPIRVLATPPPTTVAATGTKNSIRVFPNPSGGMIYVSAGFSVSLQLHSPEGRLLRQRPAATALEITDLPAGIYYLTISDAATGAVLKREKVFRR